ncbi:hypothetical protein Tco_0091790 [Tanacetum coccineum]
MWRWRGDDEGGVGGEVVAATIRGGCGRRCGGCDDNSGGWWRDGGGGGRLMKVTRMGVTMVRGDGGGEMEVRQWCSNDGDVRMVATEVKMR